MSAAAELPTSPLPEGRPTVGEFYEDAAGTIVEVRAIAWPTCVVCDGERLYAGPEFARRFRAMTHSGGAHG